PVRKPRPGRITNERWNSSRSQEACASASDPEPMAHDRDIRGVLHHASLSGTLGVMDALPPPLAFVVFVLAGWVNRQQQAVIEYLLEENRVLRAAHGRRRLRLTDDQRRRLAVKGKALGRRRLGGIVGIVTPDTILRW